ncbi:hypothetical protein PVA17_20470 [Lysinibacillus sp. CNPSo 3705]|uniref:hypothetical protein n=1 Tax=Lysinibacillus sp. CNPSo 3705 TaxID=3028148 RepID=UPI0023634A77|nr:hypothetical protein [Lysinibacillus sp. CNPSo 3705]MDD1505103.1 hypothetical protein [Lysinibacillus sp. CNPSo 3705]
MKITKTPIEMYISATDLFGIDELYSKVPDTLLHPRENKKVPKKNIIHPIVDIVFIA